MKKVLEFIVNFDGFFYYLFAVICVILIMAIMGYLMERAGKKLEKEQLAVKLNDNLSRNDQLKPEEVVETVKPNADNNYGNPKATDIIDFSAPSSMQNKKSVSLEELGTVPIQEPNIIADEIPVIPQIQGDIEPSSNIIPEIQDFTSKN
ncbi:MAG: hypothetical protein RSB99_00055 [Bacilli bacterium]